jgi:hypothetical protein
MRRPVGLVLVGLGAFLLSLAPLVRFYVADQMVRAPRGYYQVTRLEARNATYFDTATLKLKTGATLRATSTVRGDVRAAGGNDDVAVWDNVTTIIDTANPYKPIQMSSYRIAFDRDNAQLVRCCGANVDGDTSVPMTGYGLLFPIANVERRGYPFFDMTTKRAVPMTFQGVERVRGVTAYRFVQNVPTTKIASLDLKLPARLLGLNPRLPDRDVDRYSSAQITVWVDPRTGMPLRHRQVVTSTLQGRDGLGRMTITSADLGTTPESVRSAVKKSNANALRIAAARTYVPVGALSLGLMLLLAGGIVALTAPPSGPPTAPPAPRRADGRYGEPSATSARRS